MDPRAPGQLQSMRAAVQLVSTPEPELRSPASRPESNAKVEASRAMGAANSKPTFDEVYEAQVEFVFRNAQRLGVADSALDDVVQQVFLVVHRRLGEIAEDAPVRAWVFGILSHVVRDYRRSLRRKSPHSVAPPIDPATLTEPGRGPFDALAREEALRVAASLLSELSDDKREIFVLSELEQLTAQEIAESIGVNANTVYSRLRAARQDFERAVERSRLRDTWRLR
jgi:RNA polymerase sigma-70 factor (ECF subfamily)